MGSDVKNPRNMNPHQLKALLAGEKAPPATDKPGPSGARGGNWTNGERGNASRLFRDEVDRPKPAVAPAAPTSPGLNNGCGTAGTENAVISTSAPSCGV